MAPQEASLSVAGMLTLWFLTTEAEPVQGAFHEICREIAPKEVTMAVFCPPEISRPTQRIVLNG